MHQHLDLQWLIEPVLKESFINDYLEIRPLIIKRNQRDYFEDLMKIEDIESLLIDCDASHRLDITMSHAAEKIGRDEYTAFKDFGNVRIKNGINICQVMSLFKEKKSTIIIHDLSDTWPALRQLVQNLSRELRCQAGTNVFITPGHSQCFQSHFDENDLFIIQLFGKKRWKIFESMITLPVEPQNNRPFDFSNLDLLHDFELEQGDILYMPRGFVHEVTTTDMVSAHITLGLGNITWGRIMNDYVLDVAFREELLRKAYFKDYGKEMSVREDILSAMKQKVISQLTMEKLEEFAKRYFSEGKEKKPVSKILLRETMGQSEKLVV